MANRILSAALGGIDAQLVEVQIDSNPGLHSFTIVGLGDKAVQESTERIGAAIKQSGLVPPMSKNRRFVVNLAPADLKKEGSAFDLPVAVAYLLESHQLEADTSSTLTIGELGLDGILAHTNGVIAAAIMAKDAGIKEIIVPLPNAAEASAIEGLRVIGAPNLLAAINHLSGSIPLPPTEPERGNTPPNIDDSWSFIQGQTAAKRALSVAAAGAHNILMSGSPGSGKTLLARAIVGLLPPMTATEAIEVAKIRSSVGLLRGSVRTIPRPFCSPHHTASPAALVGGGTNIRPGQVSLAHRGVLFLDELPEFPRNVLESLRQPLEDGTVTISRASGSIGLPAKFMLVGAMNPCPCGNMGDVKAQCVCSPVSMLKYTKRISGPLMDRIDIQLYVSREGVTATKAAPESFTSARAAVLRAREIQRERLKSAGLFTNSEVSHRNIDRFCALSPAAEKLLASAVNQKHLSLRSYHKIKKVSRSIADLEASGEVHSHHVAEALMLRMSERPVVA